MLIVFVITTRTVIVYYNSPQLLLFLFFFLLSFIIHIAAAKLHVMLQTLQLCLHEAHSLLPYSHQGKCYLVIYGLKRRISKQLGGRLVVGTEEEGVE